MRSLPEAGYKVSGHKYWKCHPAHAAGSPAGLRNLSLIHIYIDAFKIYVSDLGLLCAKKDLAANDILLSLIHI